MSRNRRRAWRNSSCSTRSSSDATVANQLSEIAEVEAQISADLPLSEVVAELINPGDLTGLIKAARR